MYRNSQRAEVGRIPRELDRASVRTNYQLRFWGCAARAGGLQVDEDFRLMVQGTGAAQVSRLLLSTASGRLPESPFWHPDFQPGETGCSLRAPHHKISIRTAWFAVKEHKISYHGSDSFRIYIYIDSQILYGNLHCTPGQQPRLLCLGAACHRKIQGAPNKFSHSH